MDPLEKSILWKYSEGNSLRGQTGSVIWPFWLLRPHGSAVTTTWHPICLSGRPGGRKAKHLFSWEWSIPPDAIRASRVPFLVLPLSQYSWITESWKVEREARDIIFFDREDVQTRGKCLDSHCVSKRTDWHLAYGVGFLFPWSQGLQSSWAKGAHERFPSKGSQDSQEELMEVLNSLQAEKFETARTIILTSYTTWTAAQRRRPSS